MDCLSKGLMDGWIDGWINWWIGRKELGKLCSKENTGFSPKAMPTKINL